MVTLFPHMDHISDGEFFPTDEQFDGESFPTYESLIVSSLHDKEH